MGQELERARTALAEGGTKAKQQLAGALTKAIADGLEPTKRLVAEFAAAASVPDGDPIDVPVAGLVQTLEQFQGLVSRNGHETRTTLADQAAVVRAEAGLA